MFARLIQLQVRPEKNNEFKTQVAHEIETTVRKQPGLLEIVTLTSDSEPTHTTVITFWRNKQDAENYARNTATQVQQRLRPFLQNDPKIETFNVDTTTGKKIATASAA